MRLLSCHANCSGSRIRSERPGDVVKCELARGEDHATDGSAQAAADLLGRLIMTLCPVALAVGCIKCPVFNICPVKGIIGDYKKDALPPADLKKKQ